MDFENSTRRDLVSLTATTLLFSAISNSIAWANGVPMVVRNWLLAVVGLKEDLIAGRINVLEWQMAIEKLNTSIRLSDLKSYLDIPNLTKSFTYSSNLADIASIALPREIIGAAGMRQWFVKVFGMRRGGAIIPHVHNNMVSSHLVISGSFHARTHDRLRDLPDAIQLRQTKNGRLRSGEIISMSDRKNNQHWLIAEQNQSMTLDIGIVRLPASWEYGQKANEYNMIYVDPTPRPQIDGTIIAPILTWEQASKKFAGEE